MFKGDISISYDPVLRGSLKGSLKGANSGTVAFEVLAVITGSPARTSHACNTSIANRLNLDREPREGLRPRQANLLRLGDHIKRLR